MQAIVNDENLVSRTFLVRDWSKSVRLEEFSDTIGGELCYENVLECIYKLTV